jgi:hypothetical protein
MPKRIKRIERRGRPPIDPTIGIQKGIMFRGRIPQVLHPLMKRAARKKGIALGRWVLECAAREIGVKIEAPIRRDSKKKSAA